jgi:hypothetical protein
MLREIRVSGLRRGDVYTADGQDWHGVDAVRRWCTGPDAVVEVDCGYGTNLFDPYATCWIEERGERWMR